MHAENKAYDTATTIINLRGVHRDRYDVDSVLAMQRTAKRWRTNHGYAGKGGIVVIYAKEVQGWVNKLRDPGHWRPGSVAVDEVGNSWEASGGNDYDGAQRWRPVNDKGSKAGAKVSYLANVALRGKL